MQLVLPLLDDARCMRHVYRKMAFSGKRISNPITGQEINFVKTAADTDGACLEMISTWQPFSKEPPAHYHPYQTEEFEVLKGSLTIRLSAVTKTLHKGDMICIAPNTTHAMWNASGLETVVRWRTLPAMQTENLLETGMGLSMAGKVNSNGTPSLLRMVFLLGKYGCEFRLAKPSFLVQKIFIGLLYPFAVMAGYGKEQRQYLD